MEEELRVGEEGARGDSGEGSLANNHSRVPNGKENDPGNEQFPGGPIPVRESSGGRAADRRNLPMAGTPYSSATLQRSIFTLVT